LLRRRGFKPVERLLPLEREQQVWSGRKWVWFFRKRDKKRIGQIGHGLAQLREEFGRSGKNKLMGDTFHD
jgi:hypothetical protein